MCILSIKVLIRKKSGNLFNDPRISILSSVLTFLLYIYIYICMYKIISCFSLVHWILTCHLHAEYYP